MIRSLFVDVQLTSGSSFTFTITLMMLMNGILPLTYLTLIDGIVMKRIVAALKPPCAPLGQEV